jgi:hypothetical protein
MGGFCGRTVLGNLMAWRILVMFRLKNSMVGMQLFGDRVGVYLQYYFYNDNRLPRLSNGNGNGKVVAIMLQRWVSPVSRNKNHASLEFGLCSLSLYRNHPLCSLVLMLNTFQSICSPKLNFPCSLHLTFTHEVLPS